MDNQPLKDKIRSTEICKNCGFHTIQVYIEDKKQWKCTNCEEIQKEEK
jgi:ribosomal protein L37AE/L43A